MSEDRVRELEKTVDRLLTALISKGIITAAQADTISTGIPLGVDCYTGEDV